MGFTYFKKSNKLTISPYTGITVVNLYNKTDLQGGTPDPYEGLDWTDGTLVNGKSYRVRFAESPDKKFRFLVRTVIPYNDVMFEDIFKAGCECCNFIDKITLGICQEQSGNVEILEK